MYFSFTVKVKTAHCSVVVFNKTNTNHVLNTENQTVFDSKLCQEIYPSCNFDRTYYKKSYCNVLFMLFVLSEFKVS